MPRRGSRSVRALIEKGRVEAIPDVQPSPILHELIAERVRVEIQKSAAERSLPAGHARIGELQTKLSELRWRMYREATSLVEELEKAADAAATREGQARARLDRARAAAPDDTDDTARLAALESDAAAKRGALEALRARHEASGATAGDRTARRRPRPSRSPRPPPSRYRRARRNWRCSPRYRR